MTDEPIGETPSGRSVSSRELYSMTYCVGLFLETGLVLLADTRTNAGVDNVSTFSKLHLFENPGERSIALMTAGNLALSQAVLSQLNEGLEAEAGDGLGDIETLMNVPSMFKAAQLVGRAVRKIHADDADAMKAQNVSFDVSFILAGQIRGRRMRLFQVYSAGNFIEATEDTCFLQIGEHKYGKPILDRGVNHRTNLEDAAKLALISMDSTLRSNLSVGMPIDLLTYRKDSCRHQVKKRITEDDPYFANLRKSWSEALRDAVNTIPPPDWID